MTAAPHLAEVAPADVRSAGTGALGAIVAIGRTAVVLVAGLLALYALLHRSAALDQKTLEATDFVQYYAVGHLVLSGNGIYDPRRVGILETQVQDPGARATAVLPYLSPPDFALAVSPLSRLPYGWAYTGWLIVNCFLVAAAVQILAQLGGLSSSAARRFRLAALCSPPVLMAIFQGQVSIAMTALLSLALLALSQGADLVGGAVLGLALLKPTYGLPFLVLLLASRRWKALAGFLLGGVLVLLAPALFLGLDVDRQYLTLLLQVMHWQGHAPPVVFHGMTVMRATYDQRGDHNLAALATLALAAPWSTIVLAALDVAALGIVAVSARASRSITPPFGAATAAAVLVSPHVLLHDLSLLLIPAAVILGYRAPAPRAGGLVLLGGLALLFVGFALSYAVPIQLSLLATAAWCLFLLKLSLEDAASTRGALPAP